MPDVSWYISFCPKIIITRQQNGEIKMANLYDLKKFDLNLLLIFECIYQHQSISKAAKALFITPSAVSQSLQRLRAHLDDPLFVRSGKGVAPTTIAINLHIHLEENLNQLEQTINMMNSNELSKKFVIYTPQLLMSEGSMALINTLRRQASYAIEHHDIFITPQSAEELLTYRKADLIISLFAITHPAIVCEKLSSEPLVLVCRADHPRLTGKVNMTDVLAEGFTLYSTPEKGALALQRDIEAVLPQRNILFSSDSYISIINIISQSDLIGIMPLLTFNHYKKIMNLKIVDVDITLPALEIFMLYNRASLNGSAFASLIDTIKLAER